MAAANLLVSLIIKTLAPLAQLKAVTKATGDLTKAIDKATAPTKAVSKATDGLKKATGEAVAPTKALDTATDQLGQAQARAERRTVSLAARLRLARMRTTEWRADLGKGLGSTLKLATLGVAGLATGTAGLAALLFNTTMASAAATKAVLNGAQAAGVTTTAYQRLSFAIDQSGVTGLDLADVLKSVNKNAISAARGAKEPRIAFRALGVDFMKTKHQVESADVILAKVADRFAKLPDGARKTALATMIFGNAGADLIPLLNKGSKGLKSWGDEAERLGLVMSDQTLKAGAGLNLQWLVMVRTLQGLRNTLVGALFPVFSQFVGWLQNILKNDRQKILDGINAGVAGLKANLPKIVPVLADLWSVLSFIAVGGAKVVKALGGISGAFDWLAAIMIGKLAFALIELTILMAGVNTAFWLFPGTWIIAAIAAVVIAAFLLIRHWSTVKKWFGDMFAKLKAWFTSFPLWAQILISPVGTIIAHWTAIRTFFSTLFGDLKRIFVDGTANIWNSLPPWFQGLLKAGIFLANPAAGLAVAAATARPSGAPRASGAPVAGANVGQGGAANVNGTIRIAIDQDGRAQVREARTDTPGFDFDMMRGYQMGPI